MGYHEEIAFDSPVAWWKMDETTGTVMNDSAGDYDGVYNGPVELDQPPLNPAGVGRSVKWGVFGGDPAYGFVADDGDLSNAASRTIEFTFMLSSDFNDDSDGTCFLFTRVGNFGGQFQYYMLAGAEEGSTTGWIGIQGWDADYSHQFAVVGDFTIGEPIHAMFTFDEDADLVHGYVNSVELDDYDLTGTHYVAPAPFPLDAPWGASDLTLQGYANSGLNGGALMQDLVFYDTCLSSSRVAEHYDAWLTAFPVSTLEGSSEASAELELSTDTFVFSESTVASESNAEMDYQIFVATYTQGAGVAESSTDLPAVERTLTKTGGTSTIKLTSETGDYVFPGDMTMIIMDPMQGRSPTALTVLISGAWPNRLVEFSYDSNPAKYWSVRADGSGDITAVSIPTPPEMDRGDHVLHAKSKGVAVDRDASDVFNFFREPGVAFVVGPDADPLEVPGARNLDGSWNWVFQDLMPGGLGSWVLTHNPEETEMPMMSRDLSAARATSNGGQHHIFESAMAAYDWTFSGKVLTKYEHDQFYAYLELNRRIYIIDHHNRAWVVALERVEIKPALRTSLAIAGQPVQLTDWYADYTVTAKIYERDWRDPIPLEDQ